MAWKKWWTDTLLTTDCTLNSNESNGSGELNQRTVITDTWSCYIVKLLNFRTPENFAVIQTKKPKLKIFHQKDANGIANSEEPAQTALGAVLSGSPLFGSPLFAKTFMSENLGHYGIFGWFFTLIDKKSLWDHIAWKYNLI